jgi:alpha-mannosidase
LVDNLIDILENDKTFSDFTLDGQTIVLEDYLEVHPERKGILKKFITEGRIHIGPCQGDGSIDNIILKR